MVLDQIAKEMEDAIVEPAIGNRAIDTVILVER
jgi:hypothetical protein